MKTKAQKRARVAPRVAAKNNSTTGVLEYPVQVNFTAEHKEQIVAAANAAGLSLAAFIRHAAVAASVKTP